MRVPKSDNIILERKTERASTEQSAGAFAIPTRKKDPPVPYRKVTYREQMWYIIKFKLREMFCRKKK